MQSIRLYDFAQTGAKVEEVSMVFCKTEFSFTKRNLARSSDSFYCSA